MRRTAVGDLFFGSGILGCGFPEKKMKHQTATRWGHASDDSSVALLSEISSVKATGVQLFQGRPPRGYR